jgi:hypothetical protein
MFRQRTVFKKAGYAEERLRLGVNFSRRHENPFQKLPSGVVNLICGHAVEGRRKVIRL